MDEKAVADEIRKIREQARRGGYNLHPDEEFVQGLVEGFLKNRERYGYDSCPCRLATGDRAKDLPIVCPCDYRDDDLAAYGACYCALYVSDDFDPAGNPLVPDRWNPDEVETPDVAPAGEVEGSFSTLKAHVCQVCGYISVRENPPRKCPICGVSHERFTEIRIAVMPPRSG